MKLTKGRPSSMEGRAMREIRVYDLLDLLGVEYEYIDHQAVMTIPECAMIDRVLNAEICKNLFLCNSKQDQHFLLMVCGEKKFKSGPVASQIGSTRLSFADEEKLIDFLDLYPGSVSVMGLMNDKAGKVQLLIDADLLSCEYVGCHPCMNTTSLRIRTEDLMEKILPAMNHEPIVVRVS